MKEPDEQSKHFWYAFAPGLHLSAVAFPSGKFLRLLWNRVTRTRRILRLESSLERTQNPKIFRYATDNRHSTSQEQFVEQARQLRDRKSNKRP